MYLKFQLFKIYHSRKYKNFTQCPSYSKLDQKYQVRHIIRWFHPLNCLYYSCRSDCYCFWVVTDIDVANALARSGEASTMPRTFSRTAESLRYIARDSLNAPQVAAVEQFRKAIEESEKQRHQKP